MALRESRATDKGSFWRTLRNLLIFLLAFFFVCFILVLIWYEIVMVRGSQPPSTQELDLQRLRQADSVIVPNTAAVGDNIQITVQFTNIGSDNIELIKIDISQSYLDGFEIEDTVPPYQTTARFESPQFGETFQSFYFHETIRPEATYVINLNSTARSKGAYRGTISICIGAESNCLYHPANTTVR